MTVNPLIQPLFDKLVNEDGEHMLLAALLCDNGKLGAVEEILSPADFGFPLLGRIFAVILDITAKGERANPPSVYRLMKDDEELAAAGGKTFLANLTGGLGLLADAKGPAREIAALAGRRRSIAAMWEACNLLADVKESSDDVLEGLDACLAKGKLGNAVTVKSAEDCALEVFDMLENANRGVNCGIIPAADKLLGRVQPKRLVVVAGRPGTGKTAFAVSYALGAAQKGHGVLFVSLEMSSAELGGRIVSDLQHASGTPIPYDSFTGSSAGLATSRPINEARELLREMPLAIAAGSRVTMQRLSRLIRRQARAFAAKGNVLELVIVDYLQLLSPSDPRRSAYESISEISRELKQAAKEHNVAIMALAQLSREVEKRDDKRPRLSDLRDSGQIEQDADAVLLLWRPALGGVQDELASPSGGAYDQYVDRSALALILAKNRAGRIGEETATFHMQYQAVR